MQPNKISKLPVYLLNRLLLCLGCIFIFLSVQPLKADNHFKRLFRLEFDTPEELNRAPRISKGASTITVAPGDQLDLSVSPRTGAVLLIIESETSPFVSGKYRVRINPGRGSNKRLQFTNVPGSYKYSIVDVSNRDGSERRPVLDPVIIIRDINRSFDEDSFDL
ncbi:hypothetical protein [Kangiella sp. TOML190]|uniref:hypothetical protein n=1 Tax=Kangiella sp. TOML190 TaxID=2931351 RepID=UPI00203B6DCE|nr:hypothetical protein [Kangiella sp. TOML190]